MPSELTQPGTSTRCVAFYLPQFHPIPENDEWWGPGFTEWTNVTRAQPRFRGHQQPQWPSELGFYDLRVPEARQAQADLATAFGIDAFCYYHYWFDGRRLLERPFEEVLRSGSPDKPFMLCWANESWTRTWDGLGSRVLIRQTHSVDDDRRHLASLSEAFHDPRYVRVDGKPVFLVYRASELPDPCRTTDTWREEARRLGLPGLYLCRVESFASERTPPQAMGFDAAVEFQPAWDRLPSPLSERLRRRAHSLGLTRQPLPRLRRVDYDLVMSQQLTASAPGYLRYPCVTPGFDNSPRRDWGAVVLRGGTPEAYERWLHRVLEGFDPPSPDENLVFVNAWNEWAEGNHLEPDLAHGRDYLYAHRAARLRAEPDPP